MVATPETEIGEIDPADSKALKSFIALERRLIGNYPRYYATDLDSDIRARLTGKTPHFDETELAIFVAPAGQPVARCAAFINKRYQAHSPDKADVGFIGHFAAAPDSQAVVVDMLRHAEGWLGARGVKRVVAPVNGSGMVGMMALTDGFDDEPMFPFGWNPPYYRTYIEAAGYAPKYPLWYFWVDFSSPEYRSTAARPAESSNVRVRPIEKKRWNEDLEVVRTLMNEAFANEWEAQAFTPAEWHAFFDPMKPMLDVRQQLIAEVDGEPAGFCMGMPDYTPIFRSFKGKLGPLQIVRFLFSAGRYKRAGLLGIGVLPKFRGQGVARALALTLYRYYESKGLPGAFYYPVNDHNSASRSFAESLGGKGRILYHCFEKRI